MSAFRSNRGLSLLELMIVVIIVGVLATVGVSHLFQMIEKGRAEEAKQDLWEIRVAWGQYVMDHRETLPDFDALNLPHNSFPGKDCRKERFFKYSINDTYAIATRCTSGGKQPQGRVDYEITLDLRNGTWVGVPR